MDSIPKENATPQELFTASDVARFCQVDLKTIHNWAEKGEIRHFRTPGRHLRFRKLDVLHFLRKYGYPIPEVLLIGKPKVVLINEDADELMELQKALSAQFDIVSFQDPFDALIAIGNLQPDALIADINMKGLDGLRCIERLRAIDYTSHIRCIVYSDDEGSKKNAMDAGAYDLIRRGDLDDLQSSLSRLMGLERS